MIVSIVGREYEIPADMLPLFENPDKLLQQEEVMEYTWADRIRVIPYKVIGQNHQLLTAIKPDILQIQHNGKEYKVSRGLISFTLQQLSADKHLSMYCSSENVNGSIRSECFLNLLPH